jgi:hypothetical protein
VDVNKNNGLMIGSWTMLCIYLIILTFGTFEFVRFTRLSASILDQLGGQSPVLTRVAIVLADGIKFSFFWLPLVGFAAFLIYKELKWTSKHTTFVVNSVSLGVTVLIGYSLRFAMMMPIWNITEVLSR